MGILCGEGEGEEEGKKEWEREESRERKEGTLRKMQGKECLLHNKHQKKRKESSHEERLFSSQPWERSWSWEREEAKRKDKESKESKENKETRKTKKKNPSLGAFSTYFLCFKFLYLFVLTFPLFCFFFLPLLLFHCFKSE